ncbi:MAG TPA: ABC transporter ATP-binding protein [Novosphingobium sp.]|nr:ABC transporter ATP-binding protein [Novosphingobium sp.]
MTLAACDLGISHRLGGVSLGLRPGEVTAICGPNGAGKSTLLAALAGLIAPGEGAVTLDGVALANFSARARAQAIGYLPQTPEIAWDVDVATLARLGRLPWRTSRGEDEDAVAAALDALDLTALARRSVSRLSGGERARALLARVLAGRPRWILADEPLASLDLAHQTALLDRFAALASAGEQGGTGVVLVLHDLARAINRATRVIVLAGGRVVADGPPELALDEAIVREVWGVEARWLGEPGARALAI